MGDPADAADEWKDLLDAALVNQMYGSNDSSKNMFYQEQPDPELFQGSAVSYIPSSKQEFLKHQQQEDENYIMAGLEAEEEEILQPFLEEITESKANNIEYEISSSPPKVYIYFISFCVYYV